MYSDIFKSCNLLQYVAIEHTMKSLFKIYIYQLNSSLQSLSGIQNYECTFDYEHRGKVTFSS